MKQQSIFDKCLISLVRINETQGKESALDYLKLMVEKLNLTDSEFQFCLSLIEDKNEAS